MNIRTFASAIALCLAVGANAQWTVVNLHPGGATKSEAGSVSGGQQVGSVVIGGSARASLWSGTAASWVNLNPAGAAFSNAYEVSGGQQVGGAVVGGVQRASLWTGTAASWVDLTPNGATSSELYDTSGAQQVGFATVGGIIRASVWNGTAASWMDLHPSAATFSYAYGVGDGQQVGEAIVGGLYQASLWSGTAGSWVNLNPASATESAAVAATGGKQVGHATVGGISHASLWSGTAASWVDLNPAVAMSSDVHDLSGGQQVGMAEIGGNAHASLWSGTAASWVDLHTFLPASFDWSYATGIWTDGLVTRVVGFGYNNATSRDEALLWTLPAPTFTLTLNKSSVAGQNSVLGTITMSQTKPTNTVFTTYDNSSLVATPPNVTVLAGQLSRNFQITTTAITSTVMTTIYAGLAAVTRSQPLTLLPLIPTAMVFTPTQVTGGSATSCRVVINGVAGPGGRVISIFDNSPHATTPSTVTVPAGATQVIFPITTTTVTAVKYVTVTARVSAGEKTGSLRINP